MWLLLSSTLMCHLRLQKKEMAPTCRVLISPPLPPRCTAPSRAVSLARPWQHARHVERSARIRPFLSRRGACRRPLGAGGLLGDSRWLQDPVGLFCFLHHLKHTLLTPPLLQRDGASAAQLLVRILHHLLLFYSQSSTSSR